jgi:predicted CXXCH cytochrome family protein
LIQKKHLISLGILLLISLVTYPAIQVTAAEYSQESNPGIADEYCLSCHDTPGLRMELPSGEELYIGVDSLTYYESSHGSRGYACVQCHTNVSDYPHPENTAQSVREYSLQMYENCRKCHEANYEATIDSTHQKAIVNGNIQAAVCTDCHGVHNIRQPDEPRSNIPNMCKRCHSEIYTLYEQSVHGSALIGDGNPDVPTCTDCHGVHNLSGPSSEESFHLFSPQICANCHADAELMTKYGISTHVFETYITDFHGTTVVLFEKISPDQETNKPVCIDCHGVHNMRMVDDPESTVIKENLLTTCQKCHPDATSNFPTSWLGHYEPSAEEAPLIFFVDLFYKIIIPVTIGGMLVFIASDISNKIFNKLERRG